MESSSLILFICLVAPLGMMFFLTRGPSRTTVAFLLLGIFMCLFAGEIDGYLYNRCAMEYYSFTVNITPLVEELLKALPIILFALYGAPERQLLLACSVATGVGFATLENMLVLFTASSAPTLQYALARGLGAGLMHGIATFVVGLVLSLCAGNRKLAFTGTVAALSAAMLYHSVFNIIVQSAHSIVALLLPLATFALLQTVFLIRSKRAR